MVINMTDTIFVLDANKNVIGNLSNNGAKPIAPFFDDNYIQELSNGAETYEFSTLSNAITSEILQLGNYIVFMHDNKYKLFQIMDTEEEHEEGSILITCYCEMVGLELLTDFCEPFSIEGNVELFFNTVLQDTNWQLGGFSESLITKIQQVKIEKYTNVYKVIQENIATYGNIEIEYRVEFDGNRILGYFIDVYANGERGNKTYKRFEYGENVKGITRKRNLYDFASAMIGVGKDNLTFKDIEWKKSNGDPADKPLGQDFIVDLEANEKFNKHGKYIKGVFEDTEITNGQDLLLKTWEKLQQFKEPKFDYEVDLAMTTTEYEDIKVGDTVYVIDNEYNPPIWVEARVSKPELSLSNRTANKCTLSNYKEVISKIKNIDNSNSQFMGISRGGYLNFNLITDGFDIRVKNKLINEKGEEYYLNIKNSKAEDFLIDKANSHTSVTQSFAIDYVNNHIYSAQVEDNKTTGNLILTKMSLTGNILEKMYLKNFGHAGQIGVSHENGKVYLWCECDGVLHSNGMNYGTKICKFEFTNNTTVNGHAGKVFDLVPGMIRVSVAVNQETNRLGVRYMDNNGMCYVSVYEYNSIITGSPKLLSTITIPKVIHSNNQPNQGFAVVGDFLYYFTGYGYDQTNNVNNSKLHCFDLKGKKIYEYLITHRLDMIMREPEGVFVREISETEHEIYLGFASGNAGARKFNIFKYKIVADDSYEFRGSFTHLNGFTCPVEECTIRTGFDGTLNRKAFLLFTPNDVSKFNVADFINNKFIVNGNVYEPIENDSIIAEIKELKTGIKLNILTSNSSNDGVDGETPQIGSNGNWVIGGIDTGKPSQGEQGLPGTDGEPAKYVRVTGEQIFKYGKGFTGTPTPSVITITSSIIGIINPKRVWSYKTPSMSDYVNMSSTDASIVIMHNDSIWGGNKSIVVRCSVGDKYDEMTLVKVADGIDGTNGLNGANGVNGKDGVSLVYKGEFASHPANPQNGWYYRNTSEGKTFVYQGAWYQMTIDGKDGLDGNNGKDGLSIEYKGELSSPPANPSKNWSYRDKENGIVYIYTGLAWEVMTYDGNNGQDGADGQNGLSIFVTYNDSLTPPTTPTGNGTTNGWHTNATSNAIWISQKIASSATDGTWGTPIKIKGETGPTGSGVESIAEEYYLSDSKETQTGGSWVTTPPTWSQGKYIWTRSKIVYTNPTATEYTNPICDTSWEVVNDLEIGSTNLLTKSNDFSTMSGYGGAILTKTYDVVVPEWGDKKGTRIVTSGGTDEVKAMKSNNPSMKWPSTDTYTISVWVKNNSTNTPVTIRGNGMHSFTKNDGTVNPGESKRIVITGKGNTSSYMQFNFQTATASDNLDITIGYAQIERGNKVTDWSPAPEDAIKEIDVMYYLSTSQTSLSGGSWSTKAPQWENGKYMWSKTVTKYNDGTTRESEPTCIAGAKGDSAYTIILSNENHTFPCQWNGNIPNAISTTTKVIALKGATEITPTIGTLPTVAGLTLTKNGATITVVANVGTSLAEHGSFDIPVTVDGIGFTKTFTWSKSKAGTNGSNGTNGSDGVSPLGVTLAGQSLMKYLDKTTAPVPATIVLKCKAMKGATEVTEKCTYQWQAYYNRAWNNIGTGSSISIAYNSSYFLNLDILQIRVNVTYGAETITLEHTISKVYDNKYISQQEIFDKLMENGNEFVYQDPETGKIYVNASYIKTGQLVADLIKGGILTLGGTGDNSLGDYGYMRVLNSAGTEEVAHLDGGEMWLDTLTCGNLIAENLDVGEINNSKMPTKLDSNVTVYVDITISDEQSSNTFTNDAVFNSLQSAIDSIPTNLNSFNATIKLNTNVNEDIEIRGASGGGIYIFLCKKYIYGNVHIVNSSARISVYGGTNTSDTATPYGIIKPSEFVSITSRLFSICVVASPNVFLRYLDVYGKKDSSNKDLYYAIGAIDMSAAYVGNVKIIGSDNGVRAGSLGRVYATDTEGKVNNYAFRAVSGGDIRLNNTKQIGGGTNVSIAAGSSIVYSTTGVTFDSSSSTGSNDNTTTVTKSVTLKSNSGDTYRSTVYNSWKKDNTVRQGDWGYGDCNGCWFFGSQFSELKGKTITKVVLKIKRNSNAGASGNVSHVIKMHNHSSRPSGMPSYLSGWSKTVSIAAGETKTITITDSAVLNAIKGGTMKGFGLQSSYSKSNYSACSGVVSASVTYK